MGHIEWSEEHDSKISWLPKEVLYSNSAKCYKNESYNEKIKSSDLSDIFL